MPRTQCPARDGQDKAALRVIDSLDVPACLVFTKRVQPLGGSGFGPCADCIPRPTLWSRIRARIMGRS